MEKYPAYPAPVPAAYPTRDKERVPLGFTPDASCVASSVQVNERCVESVTQRLFDVNEDATDGVPSVSHGGGGYLGFCLCDSDGYYRVTRAIDLGWTETKGGGFDVLRRRCIEA